MIEGGLDKQAEGFFTEGQGHGPFLEHLLCGRTFLPIREGLDKSILAPTPSPMTWVPVAFRKGLFGIFFDLTHLRLS